MRLVLNLVLMGGLCAGALVLRFALQRLLLGPAKPVTHETETTPSRAA